MPHHISWSRTPALLLLPPGGVCGEIRPLGAGGGHIGVAPGAGGHQLPLGAGLDNGNIQQGEEGGIGAAETDGKGLGAAGGNGGDLAQPSGVPGRVATASEAVKADPSEKVTPLRREMVQV